MNAEVDTVTGNGSQYFAAIALVNGVVGSDDLIDGLDVLVLAQVQSLRKSGMMTGCAGA